MKSILVSASILYQKIEEILSSDTDYIEVSICDEEMDHNDYSPSVIHLDAYKKDGTCEDFESIDSIQRVLK